MKMLPIQICITTWLSCNIVWENNTETKKYMKLKRILQWLTETIGGSLENLHAKASLKTTESSG